MKELTKLVLAKSEQRGYVTKKDMSAISKDYPEVLTALSDQSGFFEEDIVELIEGNRLPADLVKLAVNWLDQLESLDGC